MFLRFVSTQKLAQSRYCMGVFMAVETLRENGNLDNADETWCEQVLGWFNERLRVPRDCIRSRHSYASARAIFWFKSTATAHVRKIHLLLTILERNGVATHMIRTSRPGYVVYEDEHQVAAVPFRDTFGC